MPTQGGRIHPYLVVLFVFRHQSRGKKLWGLGWGILKILFVFYKYLYLRQLLNSSLYDVHVKLETLVNYLWKEILDVYVHL